jgi:hypothetical protein
MRERLILDNYYPGCNPTPTQIGIATSPTRRIETEAYTIGHSNGIAFWIKTGWEKARGGKGLSRAALGDCLLQNLQEGIDRHPMHHCRPLDGEGLGQHPAEGIPGYSFHAKQFHDLGDIALFGQNIGDARVFGDFHYLTPIFGLAGHFLDGRHGVESVVSHPGCFSDDLSRQILEARIQGKDSGLRSGRF